MGFIPEKFDEDGKPTLFRWDSNAYRASLSPAKQRNWDRRHKFHLLERYIWKISWTNWPILRYVYTFWYNIMDEGIKNTCKPRWGSVTFGWLNDGMKPTVWHTWRQLTHNHVDDPYTGIYPSGAPKSLKQAQEWDAKWEQERLDKELAPIRETEGWNW